MTDPASGAGGGDGARSSSSVSTAAEAPPPTFAAAARDGAPTSGDPGGAAPLGYPWRVLGELDAAADRIFDRARGRPVADTAARVMSNLSDYGFVWAVLAVVKARRPGPSRRRALTALAVAGVASATVNTGVKRMVGRQRPEAAVAPTPAGRAVLPVRRPTSSSFPSGHTLAAFCTAVTLPDRPGEAAACLALAAGVAASRVHLQAHHASDVVGGAVIGGAVGLLVRRIVSLLTAGIGPARE